MQALFVREGFEPPAGVAGAQTEIELIAALEAKPDLGCCYWCRASGVSRPLMKCGKCGTVEYCSRGCQLADWAAFHKGKECKGLRGIQGEINKSGLAGSRYHWLRKESELRATLPLPCGSEQWKGEGNGGMFEGDCFQVSRPPHHCT